MRPADRPRILEIAAGVWDGHDYLPAVLDAWIADPAAEFQAAELEGEVVGVQRLRPAGAGLLHYEGLRVASDRRRRGIARAMLGHALAGAAAQGFRQVRLVTGMPEARSLFESEGFRLLAECAFYLATRVEGGEPPRMPQPPEVAELARRLEADPATAAYGGVYLDWEGVHDVDAGLLQRFVIEGRARAGPGGRALALVQLQPERTLRVGFLAGSGAALQDLLTALRYEADSAGLEGVRLLAPPAHPGIEDVLAVGYHSADDHATLCAYARDLPGA